MNLNMFKLRTRAGKINLTILTLILFFGVLLSSSILEDVAADAIVINQVPITGTLQYWTDPGTYLQKFGSVTY